jgi:hypothetical protein
MIKVYALGQLVRVTGLFEDDAGTDIDPATVTLEVLSPSGVVSTYVYQGSPDTVERDSVGNYHVDVTANEIGDWFYVWTSTGTGQGAEEGQFMVAPSHF